MPEDPWPLSRPRGASAFSATSPGFTLLELLLLILLLAILAALALPGMRRARDHASALVCRNHLRQWGMATQLYSMEHDDRLPPEGIPNPAESSAHSGWYIQLPPQISLAPYHSLPWRTNASLDPGRTVWLCPSNRRRSNGRNLFHYCLNQHIDGTSERENAVLLSHIAEPSCSVWLFDSKNLPAVGYWGFVHTNLHKEGAHFLFLDGHVARFKNTDYWDFSVNRAHTNHPQLRWIP
jgi:prepilin-type processing-associated H-X9-DG protein